MNPPNGAVKLNQDQITDHRADHTSHFAIMNQVRQNILHELLERSEKARTLDQDLMDFLALEPISLPIETIERIGKLGQRRLGVAMIPEMAIEEPRRPVRSSGLRGGLVYLRNLARYAVDRQLAKLLQRVLVTHVRTRTFLVAQPGTPVQSGNH